MSDRACPACRAKFVAKMKDFADKSGLGDRLVVDEGALWSRCKIPYFTHDYDGNPVVHIWNCVEEREITLTQAEYIAKRRSGEL